MHHFGEGEIVEEVKRQDTEQGLDRISPILASNSPDSNCMFGVGTHSDQHRTTYSDCGARSNPDS